MSEPDFYDRAVAYLTEHPEEIFVAWSQCTQHPAGPLFAFATPTREDLPLRSDGKLCGCLSQIRMGEDVAWTDELTASIRADEDVPLVGSIGIKTPRKTLEHFARWNRRIDAEINRMPPVWREPEAVQ